MSGRSIQQLLYKLQELQIQRQENLRVEQETLQELREKLEGTRGNQARSVSPTPLEAIHSAESSIQQRLQFSVGDRVYIENKIRHVPVIRRANPKDRAAVVQRVKGEQIHIVTYNGYNTWRKSSHLRHLSTAEHHNIISTT